MVARLLGAVEEEEQLPRLEQQLCLIGGRRGHHLRPARGVADELREEVLQARLVPLLAVDGDLGGRARLKLNDQALGRIKI